MSKRRKRLNKQPNLLIYYASQSPLSAAIYGHCYFCGKPLHAHEYDLADLNYQMEWANPLTGEIRKLTLPFRVEGHHIRFACLREREDQYPSDFDNVVWVPPKCHRQFHADISRKIAKKLPGLRWDPSVFEDMMKPINYGRLYLNPNTV